MACLESCVCREDNAVHIFMLPAYNEERCLGALLARIKAVMEESKQEYRVFVVDDGSSDGTAQVALDHAQEMPITLFSHQVNLGLGAALRTGLKEACKEEHPEAVVITMDADDTHDPKAVPGMWQYLQDGKDVVIASRYGTGGGEVGVTWMRRLCSKVICTLLRLFFPIPGVRDYSSGYRLYRSSILRQGFAVWGDNFVSETGFTCMAEVLLKLHRIRARIGEVGVPIRYDRKQSTSKLQVVHTILLYFLLIVREIWADITWKHALAQEVPPSDVDDSKAAVL